MHVFFFRGLSTYGHDNAKWSLLDFGPVYKHLMHELKRRGAIFHPVLGMGSGTLAEVSERAFERVSHHAIWRDPQVPVHFLGHSAGGLVARLVASRLQRPQLRSVLTIATPHQGAALASYCLTLPDRYRGSYRIMRALGYDVAQKSEFFGELTAERVRRSLELAVTGTVRPAEASIVCWAPRNEWCTPLKLFYKLHAFRDFTPISDGVVERDSQPWGRVVAEIKIDHFRQVGLFGGAHRFHQLCEEVVRYFASV